jgi:hypothetical protein
MYFRDGLGPSVLPCMTYVLNMLVVKGCLNVGICFPVLAIVFHFFQDGNVRKDLKWFLRSGKSPVQYMYIVIQ